MVKAILILISLLLAVGIVSAAVETNIANIQPVILPDNFLYKIKIKVYEPILILVGDDEVVKIELAQVRLAEMREMAKKGKPEYIQGLRILHWKLIAEVETSVSAGGTDVAKVEKGEKVKILLERHKVAVTRLQELLASEKMPEASKEGLTNALMHVSEDIEVAKIKNNDMVEAAERTLPESLKADLKSKAQRRVGG